MTAPNDFYASQQTMLMPEEEAKFQQWRSSLPARLQSDTDYDLKGFWRKYPNFSVDTPGQHMTDEFKLPNHETFSNESRYYNDQTKHLGGAWQRGRGGSWIFEPNDPRYKRRIIEDVNGNRVGESGQDGGSGAVDPETALTLEQAVMARGLKR